MQIKPENFEQFLTDLIRIFKDEAAAAVDFYDARCEATGNGLSIDDVFEAGYDAGYAKAAQHVLDKIAAWSK